MGLFNLFKKKEQPIQNQENKILLAMPMFGGGNRYDINKITDYLKKYWNLSVTSIDGDNDTAILDIDGEKVAIAFMPAPIPSHDIEETARYAYNWPTILDDVTNMTGHAIVSVMSGSKTTAERYKLLSKVLHTILVTSDAIGIYQGSQTLLIPKDQYVESAQSLKDGANPISLWVYLGLRTSEDGNSIYTYGLKEFGKHEMEIINSKLNLEELYDFISNICAYVIGSNVSFNHGETLGYTADQKIKITLSKGQFIDGQTLKLEI